MEDIRKFRKKPYNHTDKQIQHELGLTDRMWFRYNKLVCKEDKKTWDEITKYQLETEFLNLKSSYQTTIKVAEEEAEKATTTQERLLARETADNAQLDIIRLMTDGPDYTQKIDDYVAEKDSPKPEKEATTRETKN